MKLFHRNPTPGFLAIEVLTLIYIAITSVMLIIWPHFAPMEAAHDMWLWRAGVVAFIIASNILYRLWPTDAVVWLRRLPLFACLVQWYPETYEFCRALPYHDALFAQADQWIFGLQPSLEFVRKMGSTVCYELMYAAYYSYYYLMFAVMLFIFIRRPQMVQRSVWTFMGAFFLFYLIYDFLAVAGPQYYFQAIGIEQAEAGNFTPVGDYFQHHQEMLPYEIRGTFSRLVHQAHEVGERPTAAFPSSHCGMCVVTMLLAWQTRNRWLFWLCMPVAILLILSTVYTRAHYAVDSIAGIICGQLFFAAMWAIFPRASRALHIRR